MLRLRLRATIAPVPSTEQPLRKDAERNRQRILDAARELFAERGLGVTLNDVAHHAGVGVGTVYRRFPDKESLLLGFITHETEQYAATLQRALDDIDDPTEQLSTYVRQQAALTIQEIRSRGQ